MSRENYLGKNRILSIFFHELSISKDNQDGDNENCSKFHFFLVNVVFI